MTMPPDLFLLTFEVVVFLFVVALIFGVVYVVWAIFKIKREVILMNTRLRYIARLLNQRFNAPEGGKVKHPQKGWRL